MTLGLFGLAIAVSAFVYLTRTPARQGAPLGCVGLAIGALIVLVAIVQLIFF